VSQVVGQGRVLGGKAAGREEEEARGRKAKGVGPRELS
jgi:hypothetical protein